MKPEALYMWEVAYMTTHPTRPNLRTQGNTQVQATTRDEALSRASFAIVRLGWNPPGEVVSTLRRFKVAEANRAFDDAFRTEMKR